MDCYDYDDYDNQNQLFPISLIILNRISSQSHDKASNARDTKTCISSGLEWGMSDCNRRKTNEKYMNESSRMFLKREGDTHTYMHVHRLIIASLYRCQCEWMMLVNQIILFRLRCRWCHRQCVSAEGSHQEKCSSEQIKFGFPEANFRVACFAVCLWHCVSGRLFSCATTSSAIASRRCGLMSQFPFALCVCVCVL